MLGLGITFSNELFFRFFGTYFLPEARPVSTMRSDDDDARGRCSGRLRVSPFIRTSQNLRGKKVRGDGGLLNMTLRSIAIYSCRFPQYLRCFRVRSSRCSMAGGGLMRSPPRKPHRSFIVYLAGSFVFSAALISRAPFTHSKRWFLTMAVSTIVSL